MEPCILLMRWRGQLNWEVGWQDLKDLFRQAGDIVRADIHYGSDGNPKGTGLVVFTNTQDAQNAICECIAIVMRRYLESLANMLSQPCSMAPNSMA